MLNAKDFGTSATRAATLEKLVFYRLRQRKKSSLYASEKGVNLIAVLPDIIKSPALTAEWESMLKQVERGEMSDTEFMKGIVELVRDLIQQNSAPIQIFLPCLGDPLPARGDWNLPRCGAVYEGKKDFSVKINPAPSLFGKITVSSSKKENLSQKLLPRRS